MSVAFVLLRIHDQTSPIIVLDDDAVSALSTLHRGKQNSLLVCRHGVIDRVFGGGYRNTADSGAGLSRSCGQARSVRSMVALRRSMRLQILLTGHS